MKDFVIEPLKGYGDIRFGMSVEEIVAVFGMPSNNEQLESLLEGNENYSVLYDYDDECVSICFEGVEKAVVASISTSNEDAVLFGERVLTLRTLLLIGRNKVKKILLL